jgi:hypothetical protein
MTIPSMMGKSDPIFAKTAHAPKILLFNTHSQAFVEKQPVFWLRKTINSW